MLLSYFNCILFSFSSVCACAVSTQRPPAVVVALLVCPRRSKVPCFPFCFNKAPQFTTRLCQFYITALMYKGVAVTALTSLISPIIVLIKEKLNIDTVTPEQNLGLIILNKQSRHTIDLITSVYFAALTQREKSNLRAKTKYCIFLYVQIFHKS